MKLYDMISRQIPPQPWNHGGKIPWDDPAFSQRMLENHLSQEHDWASRRFDVIDRQVQWLASQLPASARILDLGCGPGFYTYRLAQLGHQCVGVDFSPASIAYAKQQAQQAQLAIEYLLSDVRSLKVSGQFDLIMMTFGELNVFPQTDAEHILHNAAKLLKPGGILLLETHTLEEVQRQGQQPPSWQSYETGLFLSTPHICLQEHFWSSETATATTCFWIIEADHADVCTYQSSMKGYTDAQYRELVSQAGLSSVQLLDAAQWPAGEIFSGKLKVYCARAQGGA